MTSQADATRERFSDALGIAHDALGRIPAESWEASSLCEGWTVKNVVAHLVWRTGVPAPALMGDVLAAMGSARTVDPNRAIADVARRLAGERTTGELLEGLVLAAEAPRARGRAELVEAVVHAYDAAHPLGIRLAFDAETTRLVAETARLTASRRVRTVLRHRVLVAEDAGWSIGRGGDRIRATAESIVLYVAGRRAVDLGPPAVRVLAPGRPGSPRPSLA